ncbi:Mrp family chromosome partitioning ATPase [Spinactinospora alkalitolerans]|uniref:Mrp family chromosome partitioning ATPase n=1 Tax=Spinactinospora alkalitolerans TaxID=687207 RepID=A0A852TS56_9ACTN|nr:Wzz/FepE/Etk N-terminal domain-containing protein [Spinactinospora alkalitolerans]NYE45553.1 Mrp family chromosome partitioning ATPase [Spinactinospora alkalitolerans]
METANLEPELADHLAVLRRRWWVIALGVFLGFSLAAAALLTMPRTYTAATSVQVRPTGIAELTGELSGRTNGEVNLDTEAQIVQSAEVAARAVENLGGADVTEARERLEITVPPNSSVLEIAYSDSTPELARDGSAAFADAYLRHRSEQVEAQIDGRLEALRAELDGRDEELAELAERAFSGTGAAQIRAETRLDAAQNEVSDLNSEINPLEALRASLVTGQVITAAVAPEEPASPIPPLWLGGGALLGLVLGLTAGYLVDRGDPRLHGVSAVRRAVPQPVLLDLHRRPGSAAGLLPASSRSGQGFHELAHTLVAQMGPGDHVLLMPGVSPGRCGSVAAVNLAAALARTDADVLLVCADLESTDATALLGLPAGPGLAEVLADGADAAELERHPAGLPGLRVLPPGEAGGRAAGLLQRGAMSGLIRELRGTARYVVIATAPTCARADAHAMAVEADAVLAVVELGRTRADELTESVRRLEHIGVDVLGTVVVPAQGAAGGAGERPRRAAEGPAPAEQAGPVGTAEQNGPSETADRTEPSGAAAEPAGEPEGAAAAEAGAGSDAEAGSAAETAAGAGADEVDRAEEADRTEETDRAEETDRTDKADRTEEADRADRADRTDKADRRSEEPDEEPAEEPGAGLPARR